MATNKLEWEEIYSVGVEELDNQHKRMFVVINELLEAINTNTPKDHLGNIIESLVKYKIFHFSTEEKYFKEFNYDGAEEHIKKHQEFNDKLTALKEKYSDYSIEFAFELVDFLEDWLINHLLVVDQKYKECFSSHGLK
ncbi:MAG: bacteriohemerythrin [Candidatus Falkowbacteria bacterium]|nr:bacteriohemerythrin [Candidatus Falkowbacteria bacterium]